MSVKRVSITIDEIIDHKIRLVQASLLKHTHSNWNYSRVMNLLLEGALKSFNPKLHARTLKK
ncbi:MAG: hypothetical protein V3T67_02780 [Nitrosopumilaceae archaeon]